MTLHDQRGACYQARQNVTAAVTKISYSGASVFGGHHYSVPAPLSPLAYQAGREQEIPVIQRAAEIINGFDNFL